MGEWINRKLLDADEQSAGGGDAPEVATALDRLSRRIEAAEHRSTLAITGIDQSVLGLVSRLQAAEGAQGDFQKDVQTALNDLREARTALAARIERLEADDTGARNLQALKSLDANLARLAEEVEQRGAETGARLEAVEQGLERAGAEQNEQVERSVADVARRLDDVEARVEETGERLDTHDTRLDRTGASLAETRARAQEAGDSAARVGDDLQGIADQIGKLDAKVDRIGADVEEREQALRARLDHVGATSEQAKRGLSDAAKSLDTLAGRVRGTEARVDAADERADALMQRQDATQAELREWMARHSDRLVSAEQATNTAIQALETSFASLDDRVKGAEGRIDKTAKAQQSMGARLDSLSREFADLVEQTRTQIAEGLSQAAAEDRAEAIGARLTTLEDEINRAERKRAIALDRIIAEVERLASSFGENLAESELKTAALMDEKLAEVRGEIGREADRLEQVADAQARRLERLASTGAAGGADVARAVREGVEEAAETHRRAIEGVREKVERVADEVRQRIATVEMNADAAVDAVSNRVTRLSEAVGETDAEALERRIRESESRTQELLDEAMSRVQRRIDDADVAEPAASRVGDALAGLTRRLEAIERREESPQDGAEPREAALDDALWDPLEAEARAPDIHDHDAEDHDADVIFEDVPGGGLSSTPFDPDRTALDERPRGRGSDEPDDLWDPFAAEDAGGADAAAGDPFVAYPDPLHPHEDGVGDDEDPASAYDDLVRRAAPEEVDRRDFLVDDAEEGVEATADAPGFGPADDEDEPAARLRRNGRAMMIAASGAAFLAVGAAAYMVASDSRGEPREPDDDGAKDDGANVPGDAAQLAAAAPEAAQTAALTPDQTRADDLEAGDDPLAQYRLAVRRLSDGENERAMRLMQRAADAGYAPAQFRLGQLHEAGRGTPQNYADARRWTERAAQAGHREAMHNLGVYYANGVGAPESYEQAARWFREAAQLGANDSQYNLGVLYEQGLGVSINLVEAYAWYAIAAASGDEAAAQRARALASRLTQTERAEGERKAAQFTPSPLDPVANGVVEEVDASSLSRTGQIAEAQDLLQQLGYDPGGADGTPGPRTETAVIAFQRAKGLPETGRVDTTLLENLRAEVGL